MDNNIINNNFKQEENIMSYESRIFDVERSEFENRDGTSYVYAEKIADVKMCSMYNGFRDIFDKEVDYELYIDSGEKSTSTDMYGDKMKYTDVQTVIDYLEKLIDSGETYRRLSLLLGMLKGIDTSQWNDIQIVHYGY